MSKVVIIIETDNACFRSDDGSLIPGAVFAAMDNAKHRFDTALDLGFNNIRDVNGNTCGQTVIMEDD